MTLQRAAWMAAGATALEALVYLLSTVFNLVLTPGPLPATFHLLAPVSLALAVMWPVFFRAIYRECAGAPSQLPSRQAAILLVTILALAQVLIRASNTSEFPTLSAAVLYVAFGPAPALLWAIFFVAFAVDPEKPGVRFIGLAIAGVVGLEGIYRSVNSLSLVSNVFDYQSRLPSLSTSDYVGISQVIASLGASTLVWIAEVIFLWMFWKTPPLTEHASSNGAGS